MGRLRCIAAAAGLSLLACGLPKGGLGGAGDAGPPDAAMETDATATEAGEDGGQGGDGGCTPGSCAGACCGDTCVSPTCEECSVGGHFCPLSASAGGSCVADCTSCTTFSGASTCYMCGDAGLSASCAASSAACPADLAAGACPCPSGSAEECPGPEQTCSMVDGAFVCLSP